MSRRLPDEYFRQTPSEPKTRSDAAGPGPIPVLTPERRAQGMPLTLVVACALATFLIGFAGMRSVLLHSQPDGPTPAPSVSSTQARSAVPYTGRTRAVGALRAESTCFDGSDPDRLLDATSETVWSCPGSGTEKSITFEFGQVEDLVGVRMVPGDASRDAPEAKERRITAVTWTFDDGSWISQPLGSATDLPQEVRFPNTETSRITLTIISATEPGGGQDQVSISGVEFLTAM